MAKDAAQNTSANGAEIREHPIILRRGSELPVEEGRWPKAWRLLFLFGAAVLAWMCFIAVARWI